MNAPRDPTGDGLLVLVFLCLVGYLATYLPWVAR